MPWFWLKQCFITKLGTGSQLKFCSGRCASVKICVPLINKELLCNLEHEIYNKCVNAPPKYTDKHGKINGEQAIIRGTEYYHIWSDSVSIRGELFVYMIMWGRSSVRESVSFATRRPGVRFPSSPPIILFNYKHLRHLTPSKNRPQCVPRIEKR